MVVVVEKLVKSYALHTILDRVGGAKSATGSGLQLDERGWLTMDELELKTLFAHAILTGMSVNGHMLTANASKFDLGVMIGNNATEIARGFMEATTDGTDTGRFGESSSQEDTD